MDGQVQPAARFGAATWALPHRLIAGSRSENTRTKMRLHERRRAQADPNGEPPAPLPVEQEPNYTSDVRQVVIVA